MRSTIQISDWRLHRSRAGSSTGDGTPAGVGRHPFQSRNCDPQLPRPGNFACDARRPVHWTCPYLVWCGDGDACAGSRGRLTVAAAVTGGPRIARLSTRPFERPRVGVGSGRGSCGDRPDPGERPGPMARAEPAPSRRRRCPSRVVAVLRSLPGRRRLIPFRRSPAPATGQASSPTAGQPVHVRCPRCWPYTRSSPPPESRVLVLPLLRAYPPVAGALASRLDDAPDAAGVDHHADVSVARHDFASH